MKYFDILKSVSRNRTTPLKDFPSIKSFQVFDDIGVARMIGDLQVKCSCHTDGCTWVGELSNLQVIKLTLVDVLL